MLNYKFLQLSMRENMRNIFLILGVFAIAVPFILLAFPSGMSTNIGAILFIVMAGVARLYAVQNDAEWTLALYPILLTVIPSMSKLGISYSLLWMLIFTGYRLLSITAIPLNAKGFFHRNNVLVGILFFAGFIMSGVNTAFGMVKSDIGSSLINSLSVFGNLAVFLIVAPLFFSLFLSKSKYGVIAICISIAVAVGFTLFVLIYGNPIIVTLNENGFSSLYELNGVEIPFVRTQLAILLSVSMMASYVLAIRSMSILLRLFSFIFMLVALGILFWSGSRAGLLAGALALIVYHLVLKPTNPETQRTVIVVVLLTIGIAGLICAFPDVVQAIWSNRWLDLVQGGISEEPRPEKWRAGLIQFLHEPIGVGWTFSTLEGSCTVFHNDFLAFAVSYGFFGGLAYIMIFAQIFIAALKTTKIRDDFTRQMLGAVALVAVVALALNSMSDHLTAYCPRFQLCWIIVYIGVSPYMHNHMRIRTQVSARDTWSES